MRNIFISVLLLMSAGATMISGRLCGEDKMSPLSQKEIADFDNSLKVKSDATISLESFFVQEKNLEMLSKKMVSKVFSDLKRRQDFI